MNPVMIDAITIEPPRAKMNGKLVFTVPAKSVINFNSGFAPKLLCDGPTFTAGTCCPYSCTFCSVPTTMRYQLMPNGWLTKQGVTGKHAEIVVRRADAPGIARRQLLSRNAADRAAKKVIYASPLTDVAANMELVRETVEICQAILGLTNWDIRLLSKSNLLPKVAQGLEDWWSGGPARGGARPTNPPRQRVIYGVSTGTLDVGLAAAFECGTARVSKRIESLHWLQDHGFRTFGMICPSLPQGSGAEYESFAREMAAAIRADRCEHVWAEVINLRGENFTNTMTALNAAGFAREADWLELVSTDKSEWEGYARETFLAHAKVLVNQGKLRFLQYVTKATRPWWEARREQGAVVL